MRPPRNPVHKRISRGLTPAIFRTERVYLITWSHAHAS